MVLVGTAGLRHRRAAPVVRESVGQKSGSGERLGNSPVPEERGIMKAPPAAPAGQAVGAE